MSNYERHETRYEPDALREKRRDRNERKGKLQTELRLLEKRLRSLKQNLAKNPSNEAIKAQIKLVTKKITIWKGRIKDLNKVIERTTHQITRRQ